MGLEQAEILNKQASIYMKRGIALMEANTGASLNEAVTWFDQVIELRRQLPLKGNPMFVYGLAAGLLNRADALAKAGSAEALPAYAESLKVIEDLPLEENPLFVRRLAIALTNRGLALQARQIFSDAERSFERAIAILLNGNAAAIQDRDYLLAAALMNLANLHVRCGSMGQARTMAKQVLVLAEQDQFQNPEMAEISLKARHILCQAIAVLLLACSHNRVARKKFIDEATDAVDEGMVLVRHWQQRGVERFQSVSQGLFNFGAKVYQMFQPQFVEEFLQENSGCFKNV